MARATASSSHGTQLQNFLAYASMRLLRGHRAPLPVYTCKILGVLLMGIAARDHAARSAPRGHLIKVHHATTLDRRGSNE
ncbi:unnamed protein product [Amoebophrya sp. A25]|nr:unnamed protein product [Amoebophrya sp. A25]|eukprot:GSA25T00012637001.1